MIFEKMPGQFSMSRRSLSAELLFVLSLGCQTASDMALLLVQIQDAPDLKKQLWIAGWQTLG